VSDWAGSLTAGATLVIRGPQLMGGKALWSFIEAQRVTHAHLPPAVWTTLPAEPLHALRVAVTSGDACPVEVVRSWAKDRLMINEYGPTEITVCATSAFCTPDRAPDIGRPIANVRAYVLDSRLEPVPDGIKGELVLGGIGLARGYLNDEEQTRERFVHVDFPLDARVYRTGDTVRRRTTGELEFLGRSDNQVKIRGHRVEPGEIEAALQEIAGVSQAVVVPRDDLGPNTQLVAYYVSTSPQVAPEAVRKHLKASLPPYLVPSHVLLLDALPLTPHGKVAREALPAPRADVAEAPALVRQDAAPPTTEASALTVALDAWRAVLGRESITADDNFFEHGGDSLMAVDLADRLTALFGRDVGVIDLFESPTVRGWVERFAADDVTERRGPLLLRAGAGVDVSGLSLVLVPPPGGELTVYRPLLDAIDVTSAIHGLVLGDEPDLDSLLASLERQVGEVAQLGGGALVLAGWSVGGVLAHALAKQLERRGGGPRALVLLDSYPPAHLERQLGRARVQEIIDRHPGSESAKRLVPAHLALATAYAPGELRAPVHHLRATSSAQMAEPWGAHTTTSWVTATHETVVSVAVSALTALLRELP
jgi:thioesterase domain-containing protein